MVPKVGYQSYTEDTGVEVSRTGRDQVELAGRADSSPGECNHTTVKLAGELAGKMVELAGVLTRVMVQLYGEWLLCGIRSFVHFRSFFQ
ncbi:hypothetical protein HID58_066098 [Brassica napus]|uniref:Uncharacterized protein n=1 Tax=Brassica napus TaxID=3708 RepID=A0ABQ7ZEQ0_BRANA|nr:hypothetical protein HID58_066098 [Brassica napus]